MRDIDIENSLDNVGPQSPDVGNNFQLIYKKEHRRLLFFANKLVTDAHIAEDIVSDSFLKLWERNHLLINIKNIPAYLNMITRNACFDHLRRNRRRELSHLEMNLLNDRYEDVIHSTLVKSELLDLSWKSAMSLPPATFKIFKLLFGEGISVKQAAEKLNLSINTVKSHRQFIIKFLRSSTSRKEWVILFPVLFSLTEKLIA